MVKSLKLPKWNKILIEILKSGNRVVYCELLGKKIKGSLPYLRKIVKDLEKQKLIEIRLGKKIKYLRLTDKGQRVANNLILIKERLK